jgi:trans-aconitate 2-methyltransferase
MPEATPRPGPASPPWDAATYDRVAAPQERWGLRVLERLQLQGDETVLDAGCGSGRVTEHLVSRLPTGTVIALDADPSMLAQARHRLSAAADRVRFVQADLHQPLGLTQPVDAVLSTATFHWVLDHDALFRNLARVLRRGGRLEAQCGGAGNIASLAEAVRRTGVEYPGPWLFATAEATKSRLTDAGFTRIRCWLVDEPTDFDDQATFEDFLATVCLRPFRDAVATGFPDWVHDVAGRLGSRQLDYVRLNISATRG